MSDLTSLGVAVIALAAVILPFALPRIGLLPFEARDVERASGPRRARTIFYALVLLILMSGGIWVTFIKTEPGRYWFGLLGGFIVLLMVAIIAPQGATKRFCLKLLEYWLVALAIALITLNLVELWVAGSKSQAILPRSRGIWISADREAFFFWYSVLLSSIIVYAALAGLREYFARVFERRASNSRLLRDASGSALERASSGAPKPER